MRALEGLGYQFDGHEWRRPGSAASVGSGFLSAADAMHDELSGRLEDLAGATAESDESAELERISELLEIYRRIRPKD